MRSPLWSISSSGAKRSTHANSSTVDHILNNCAENSPSATPISAPFLNPNLCANAPSSQRLCSTGRTGNGRAWSAGRGATSDDGSGARIFSKETVDGSPARRPTTGKVVGVSDAAHGFIMYHASSPGAAAPWLMYGTSGWQRASSLEQKDSTVATISGSGNEVTLARCGLSRNIGSKTLWPLTKPPGRSLGQSFCSSRGVSKGHQTPL
mmetsp:Transcript_65282/g.142365  ORF Transcript_65282/g.142365 Transcript_65282/m.142365 type:complete len:208 (+) Transcript_65282:204-827(+)